MTSVARSASHDCGGTGGFWKCSHAAGGSEREEDIQDRIWHFEKRTSEILKISGFFLTFTETQLVLRSHLALHKDFSQRKCCTDESPGRRDVLFHHAVKYFTLK